MTTQKAQQVTMDVFTYVYPEVTPAMVREPLETKAKAQIAQQFAGKKIMRINHKEVLIELDQDRQDRGLDRPYRATLSTELWIVS